MSNDKTFAAHNNMAAAEERRFNLQLFAEGDTPPAEPPPGNEPPPATPPPANDTPPAEPPKPTNPPATPPGAPEAYTEFKVAEGVTFLPEVLTEFQTYAKAQNWTQEQAQANVDFFVQKVAPQMQAAQAKAWETQVNTWTKESETKHGKEGIEAANKALGRFSTPEFVEFLKTSGLGVHPEMVGMFRQIGKAISESKMFDGNNSPGPKSYADIMFGDKLK